MVDWYCLFACLVVFEVVGWMDGCVCVKRGIGSCEVVYSSWGLSSSACFEDFGSCYLVGWRCGMITGFGAFGSWYGYESCRFYLMDGAF